MPRLIDSTAITTPCSKLIELDGAYSVLGGQIYLRSKTVPVPFSFLSFPSGPSCESSLKKFVRMPISTMVLGDDVKNGLFLDDYIPDTHYVITNGYGAYTLNGIHKITKNGNKYTRDWFTNLNNTGAYNSMDIITQDENYIYILAKNQYATPYANALIYKVKKSDATVTYAAISATNLFWNTPEIFYKIVGGKLYGATFIATTGKMNFFYISLDTMTITFTASATTHTNVFYASGDLYLDGDNLYCYAVCDTNSIVKFNYNISSGVITETTAITIPYALTKATAATSYVRTRCLNIENKAIVTIQQTIRSEVSAVLDTRISSYSINADGTLTHINTVDMGFSTWKTFMYDPVDSLIFLCDTNKIDVLSIARNTDYSLMKVTTVECSNLHTFAKDSMGRYFMISTDTSFYVFNPEIPVILTVDYAKKITPFDGTRAYVDNSMTINLKNHLGDACSGTLNIKLVGPATFTDGTTSKDVTISGSVTVPFRIINTGDISVKIKNK